MTGGRSRSTAGDHRNLNALASPIQLSSPMVARLIFASPSHAVSVPISNANGSPDEKPNASIDPALRDLSATPSNLKPFGRPAAAVAIPACSPP